MNADIRPQPSAEDRALLLAALEEAEQEASPYASAWRRSALEPDDDETIALRRPRASLAPPPHPGR